MTGNDKELLLRDVAERITEDFYIPEDVNALQAVEIVDRALNSNTAPTAMWDTVKAALPGVDMQGARVIATEIAAHLGYVVHIDTEQEKGTDGQH